MRIRPASIASLTAIATVFVVGTAYLTFGLLRVDWFRHYTTASIQLTDAVNLVPRSPVLLSGIKVGQVTSVDTMTTGVMVNFRIDDDYHVPLDSGVIIEHLSALSEPYIEFEPNAPGGPYIADGQRIGADDVRMPASIPEMARALTTLLKQFDPQAISSIVTTFSQALDGTQAVIPDLARASDLLAATLLSRDPQIRRILENAQVPGPEVAKAGADLAAAGPEWGNFGTKVTQVVDSIKNVVYARPVPEAYTTNNGLLEFLPKVKQYVDRIGPDMVALYPAVGPWLDWASGELPGGIDLSTLVEQALQATGPDGSLRLQINVNDQPLKKPGS